MTEPLWRVMLQIRFPGTPWHDLKPSADEKEELEETIKAIADWMVPEEASTAMLRILEEDGYVPMRLAEERQLLRARLLEQARVAREGE